MKLYIKNNNFLVNHKLLAILTLGNDLIKQLSNIGYKGLHCLSESRERVCNPQWMFV